jgi:hypothetical protein
MPITPKARRAQARREPACRRSGHPDPIIGLSAYDGTTHAGTVMPHGGTFITCCADEKLIGTFRSHCETVPGRRA